MSDAAWRLRGVGKFVASVSPPTALSLTGGLDEYVELLSGAAKAAG